MIRQHNIAKSAFDCVDTRDKQYGQDKANKKSYGALAHKLPMLIMQNGMAQATGFLWAKGSNEHLKLMDDLAQVIRAGAYDFPHPSTNDLGENGKALHRHILESNIQQLTHLTRIALDASGALRRYVQGVMHIDATGEEQGNQSEKEN